MRQKQALNVMLSGESSFLTGPPGAGKTFVLNEFVRRAEKSGKNVGVTASTGIAATHIGGTTIHSWSGLGIRENLSDFDKKWLRDNERLRKRYNATDSLVIDEVSMLHGSRLDMLNETCKLLRDNEEPFGGLQIILVGDLFQLPPISRESEATDFVYNSAAWQELKPKICYLNEQHRQQDDRLLALLEAMRRDEVEEWHTESLLERIGKRPSDSTVVTRLYTHNIDVDMINQKQLSALDSKTRTYVMETKGNASKVEQMTRSVLAPETLELKTGAEVMFVANKFADGFVNGSRGRVEGFEGGMPVIKLVSSRRTVTVEPHTWTLMEDGKKRAEVTQLPLRLAWAITIHKSQGMSLDAAEIDLGKSFTPGMGYVALSRVRSLDGIFLTNMNAMAMRLHPEVFKIDAELRDASGLLASQTSDVEDVTVEEERANSLIDDALLLKLKQWRHDRASAENIPAYIVAHDSSLKALATMRPLTTNLLLAIPGFGSRKVEIYGEELMKLIVQHCAQGPSVANLAVGVRSYQDEDYTQLKKLTKHSEWFGGVFDEARDGRTRLAQTVLEDPEAILVYQGEKGLCGTISIVGDTRVAMLFRFIVKDHDQAVASALYAHAAAILKKRGHEQVFVYTARDSKQLDKRYDDLGMYRGGLYRCYWGEL